MYCKEFNRGKTPCKKQCEYCLSAASFEEAQPMDYSDSPLMATYNTDGPNFEQTEDLINKPNHYHKGGFDIYEIMQMKMTPEEYRGFCKGNVLKYLLREDMKGGVADIKKLRFNADRLIENMEGKEYIPEHKKKSEGVKGQC